MTYNWKALEPHRPLSVEDVRAGQLYVPRAGEGAQAMAALFDAGFEQPIAIFGPAGSGKSTELAALAQARQKAWVGPLVRLDKIIEYGAGTSVDDVLSAIATFTIRIAIEKLKLPLSSVLRVAAGYAETNPTSSHPQGFDLLLAAVREIRKGSTQHALALLVDGLEKASTGLARGVLVQLARLHGEAQVAVVVPTSVATGPDASVLHDYRILSIGAVIVSSTIVGHDVAPEFAERGVSFLREIALRRLGVATFGGLEHVQQVCAKVSGGLVRTSLQLLHNAALYATMRGLKEPDINDVTRAARDQTNFLLRVLKEGDVDALHRAHGTDGLEVEIDRRVRFLANGLLLEYETPLGPVVCVAPTLINAVVPEAAHG